MQQEHLSTKRCFIHIHHFEETVKMECCKIPFGNIGIILNHLLNFKEPCSMGRSDKETCPMGWLQQLSGSIHKETGTNSVTYTIDTGCIDGSIGVSVEELKSGQHPIG